MVLPRSAQNWLSFEVEGGVGRSTERTLIEVALQSGKGSANVKGTSVRRSASVNVKRPDDRRRRGSCRGSANVNGNGSNERRRSYGSSKRGNGSCAGSDPDPIQLAPEEEGQTRAA